MTKATKQPVTLKTAQDAKPGTVVVNNNGVVAQKHGPNCWYLAQDWEGSITDRDVVGYRLVTVTRWKSRIHT